jgi:hypothetical protein
VDDDHPPRGEGAEGRPRARRRLVPRLRPRRRADAAAAKSLLVLGDPSRKDELVPIERRIELFDDGRAEHGDATAGDGIFSAQIETVVFPGLLTADIVAEGSSARLGAFRRQLHASATIRHADWSLGASSLRASFAGRRNGAWTIKVVTRPRDILRNDLGIGMRDRIRFTIPGATALTEIVDNLDGTYTQTFSVPSLGVPVAVSIDRAPAFQRGVRTALFCRWLILLLLLILLLIVVWLELRSRK